MGVVDVSVVIPAYNEELRIPATLAALTDRLPQRLGSFEVLVVDDGSDDATVEVVSGHPDARVRVLTQEQNLGKGAALRAGIGAARGDVVVLLDADLPVDVNQIADLVDAAAGADLVVGSRRLPGSSVDPPQPLVRRVGGGVFIRLVRVMGYGVTSDPQCGVKVLRAATVAPIAVSTSTDGFAFDAELIDRCRRNRLQVLDRPVAWRHVEGSTLRPFRDVLRTLGELWRLRSDRPVAVAPAPRPVP